MLFTRCTLPASQQRQLVVHGTPKLEINIESSSDVGHSVHVLLDEHIPIDLLIDTGAPCTTSCLCARGTCSALLSSGKIFFAFQDSFWMGYCGPDAAENRVRTEPAYGPLWRGMPKDVLLNNRGRNCRNRCDLNRRGRLSIAVQPIPICPRSLKSAEDRNEGS